MRETRAKEDINRKTIAYYVYYVASQAAFDRGIFVLFLLSKNFSGQQIGWLQAALFWSAVAFEVPTGIIGDRYGRKLSVAVGLGLFIFYCASAILLSGFVPFLLLYCIYGLAKSFISGSDRALIFDYLKANGREGDFLRIDSRSKALGAISLSVAMVVGGYLQRVGWTLVYLAYGLTFVVSLVAWSRIREVPPMADPCEEPAAHDSILRQIRKFFLDQPGRSLSLLIVASALVVGTMTPYFVFSQAIFKGYGLEPYQIGAIFALTEVLASLAYLLAERVSRLLSVERAFYVAAALTAGLLLLSVVYDLRLSVIVFLLVGSLAPLFEVLIGNYFISRVSGPIRASAMSIVSFAESVVISVGYLGYGYALESLNIHRFVAATAILPCLAAGCAYVHFKKRKGAFA